MSIKVEKLTKIYGTQKAVDHISFEVKPGEVVGFLGPNGAGKSTTMKIITGYLPPTSGQAWVTEKDVRKDPMAVRRHIGYLPEHNPLYEDMYVREYLAFLAGVHRLGKKASARIDEMISLTGLSPERKKRIGQLSKGYRQRIGLAQAMLHDPKVLILDEPTSGLDPNQLIEIRELIKQMGQEKTVLLSSHIMQEVQAVCDRVVIIHQGKIVADDRTENLQQAKGANRVLVEFGEEVSRESLLKIKGVKDAKSLGNHKWSLSSGQDIRHAISEYARENQLTLLTIQQETTSLEDIFHQLTRG